MTWETDPERWNGVGVTPEVRLEWAEMRAYPCDYCGAGSGEWCWNQASNAPFGHGPGHHSRIFRAALAR